MGIGRLIRRILGDSPEAAGLLSVESLHRLLERERLRSDRTCAPFSLVAFRIPREDIGQGEPELIHLLRQRLRAIDDAGRLADGRIAALLPETDADGAWTLVDELAETYARRRRPLECEVYSYPPLEHREPGPISRRPVAEMQTANETNDDDAEDSASDHDSNGNRDRRRRRTNHESQRPARPLEAIFTQALPWWKRGLDLCGASLVLLPALPVLLAAALAIKLTSRGPVLFAQARAGLGGQPFIMYKLRTMSVDAERRKAELRQFSEQDGPAFKMTNDPRVTRVGAFLRKTSIDELPQLWNVLRGEMSLVGPRPLPVEESAGCETWQRRRLDVTPGLTCTWQVSGRSLVSFADWVRMDLQYTQRRTLLHDLKLLLLTVPAVVLRRGK